MPPWSPGATVVVLGAGASRGAEFVERDQPLCRPPLNADFFTQLQRVTASRHQASINDVLGDVLTLYGADFDLTLEQYFTQLEAMLDTVRGAGRGDAGRLGVTELGAMRTRLLVALSAVLEESADVAKSASPARKTPCSYHARLVDTLKPKDTIISFNYDCLIDHALRTSGRGKWSARYGYAFPNPARVEGTAAWDAADAPAAHNKSVNLLKLHGSLNWFPFPADRAAAIRLREKPYKQAGQKLYEIIPPEYAKSVSKRPVFQTLWSHAELAIRKARKLVFIGFSFTPTDLHVEALFRLALAEGSATELVLIVNPAHDHRKRIRTIVAPALKKGARVVQFDRLREAAPHFAELLE